MNLVDKQSRQATVGSSLDELKPVVSAKSLSLNYGKLRALHNVDLEVPPSAIYAVVGPNGSGKTTLLRLLVNILPPTHGTLEILGSPSQKLTGVAFNHVGYVSESQQLPEWMSVRSFIDYVQPLYKHWSQEYEKDLLDKLRLPIDRPIKDLPRGDRMKVRFLAALPYRPSLLVLDEPFSGIDSTVRSELIDCLLDHAPECTIVIASHELSEMESFITHVAHLNAGHLLFSEEIELLSERFREIEVRLEREPLQGWLETTTFPSSWIAPQISSSTVRFVHCKASQESLDSEIRKVLPEVVSIRTFPMALSRIVNAINQSFAASTKEIHE